MEWSSLPVEILEYILVATASPHDVANACCTCKAWLVVDKDQHVWKVDFEDIIYYRHDNIIFKKFSIF